MLFFGGSAHDLKLRAYDSANGKILWEGKLPGHGVATPATYAVNGKQYVVIAVSPTQNLGESAAANPPSAGDTLTAATYVVFALQDERRAIKALLGP
jgi:glucose dehydrogenase